MFSLGVNSWGGAHPTFDRGFPLVRQRQELVYIAALPPVRIVLRDHVNQPALAEDGQVLLQRVPALLGAQHQILLAGKAGVFLARDPAQDTVQHEGAVANRRQVIVYDLVFETKIAVPLQTLYAVIHSLPFQNCHQGRSDGLCAVSSVS